MNVLLVGAGAVGQVYGFHLRQGGADVTFMVREKYAEQARAGFTLYPHNRRLARRFGKPARFADFGVVTSNEEVAASPWDFVILCVSSTALRGGWLDDLAEAIGDATLVMLQPGLEDQAFVKQRFAGPLIAGVIMVQSYHAPLADEPGFEESGMAYWFPPLAAAPFSGPTEAVDRLVGAFRAGRMPAKRHPDVGSMAGYPTAVMMPVLVALENEGWSFKRLKRSEQLKRAVAAAREAMAVVSASQGTKAPLAIRLIARRFVLRVALTASRWVMPFDLEKFFEVHFTKVGDQTRLFMETYLQLAAERELPSDALGALMRDSVRHTDRRAEDISI